MIAIDDAVIETKALGLINAGILRLLQYHFTEGDVELEVAKQVDSDLVKPITQKIISIAKARGIIKDASWYAYHAGFIKLTGILFLIFVGLLFYRTWM